MDLNGRVTVQYLLDWRFPESNLHELIKVCAKTFGDAPPVFNKSKSQMLKHQASVVSLPPSVSSPLQSSRISSVKGALTRQASLQERGSSSSTNGSSSIKTSNRTRSVSNREGGGDTDNSVSEEHLRLSLVSAAEAKVKARMDEEAGKTRAEVESLHTTNKELLDRQEKVEEAIKAMTEAEEEVKRQTEALSTAERDLNAELERLTAAEGSKNDVDSFVTVGSALEAKLVDSHVSDTAIEDAVYHLGRALHDGTLECEVYLKRVRNLSRLQFGHRAVANKCRAKLAKAAQDNDN